MINELSRIDSHTVEIETELMFEHDELLSFERTDENRIKEKNLRDYVSKIWEVSLDHEERVTKRLESSNKDIKRKMCINGRTIKIYDHLDDSIRIEILFKIEVHPLCSYDEIIDFLQRLREITVKTREELFSLAI